MKLTILIILSATLTIVYSAGLYEEFTWTRITYRWPKPGPSKRQVITESRNTDRGLFRFSTANYDSIVFEDDTNILIAGNLYQEPIPKFIDYIYENNIPMGANVWKNKLFITVPRRRAGVASTLNYVPLDSKIRHNIPLVPYPNWQINLYPPPDNNSDNFASIYRIAIDPCDRLWAVDTGLIENLGVNATRVKPATIIAIDLHTDTIIHKYEIPERVLGLNPGFATVTVDVTEDTCSDAYLYLPDLSGYGLIVYSLRENKSWRVAHNYFYLESTTGDLFIAGYRFQWNDGVFSVELSDIKPDGFRDMYFHPLVGLRIYKVSTKILRNETLATRSYHGNDFEIVGVRGENFQSSAGDIHKPSGVMFLGLINQNALGCWKITNPLNTLSIVQKNDEIMIYPSDVKVSKDRIFVLTNTMPRFIYGRLNYDQVNFRVWSNTIENAIQGTKCV